MIRKLISCVLAGLLTFVPALAFLFGLLGHWQPGSGLVALPLIFSFVFGVVWLGTEVSEIFKVRKPSWEEQYAQNIYDGFVISNDPGDISALKLRLSGHSMRQYLPM